MPVLSRCPLCRAVLPAAAAEAPGEVRCPRCGEMVLPSSRKLCARCGRDVTHEKRVRAPGGEYFCPGCWSEAAAEYGGSAAYTCAVCGGSFTADQIFQDGDRLICRACHTRQ